MSSNLEEYIKHVRSIHFALVVTAGALILGISSKRSDLQQALEQLRDVRQLHNKMDADFISNSIINEAGLWEIYPSLEDFIEDSIILILEDLELNSEMESFSYHNKMIDNLEYYQDRYQHDYKVWLDEEFCLLSDGKEISIFKYDWRHEKELNLNGMLERLDKLIRFDKIYRNPVFEMMYHTTEAESGWRSKEMMSVISEQLDGVDIFRMSGQLLDVILTDDKSREIYEMSKDEARESPSGYYKYDFESDVLVLKCEIFNKETEADGNSSSSFNISFPVMFDVKTVKFIGEELQNLNSKDEVYPRYLSGIRSCERLFPELYSLTNNLRTASFEDIESYLKEQIKQSDAPISILGLTISQNVIGLWGVVIMLGIQLYFCMHYQAFVKHYKMKAKMRYPWVGLYDGYASMIPFHISIILPVMVCLYMLYKSGLGMHGERLLFVVLASLLFIWTEIIYLDYKKKVRYLK